MSSYWAHTQSRQSAKLFLQSSELGLPQPLTRLRVFPPPSGGRGTLASERGREGWESPNFERGDIHRGSLFVGHSNPYQSLCLYSLYVVINEPARQCYFQYIPSMLVALLLGVHAQP
jgi:hypothetical protein